MTTAATTGLDRRIDAVGVWLRDHQTAIRRMQWVVVAIYFGLLVTPTLLPLPDGQARILGNVTLFAAFAFWGLWWPFVLLSMVIVGRAWCGLLCPEGAITEFASGVGLGRALPRWITWQGWPFAAFALTTVYGQLVSVYQYPKPAALILGGSTLAAIVVGFLYGRQRRVWCRYLCPVNGVFGLLSKLSPLHFTVDHGRWRAWEKVRGARTETVTCAPMVVLPKLDSASPCHMCGRCSHFRDAVTLARRSPNAEIVSVAGRKSDPWETALIVFGLLGIAGGAFHWSNSDWLIVAKQSAAGWLVAHGLTWLIEPILPWWLLTNYPEQNDMLSPLDGVLLVGYIVLYAGVLGAIVSACVAAAVGSAGGWQAARFHHLAQSLIPVAGCGVFLGLSSLSVTMLRNEGLAMSAVPVARAALLAGAALWSLTLAFQIMRAWGCERVRAVGALLPLSIGVAASVLGWASLFWHLPMIG